MKKAKFKIGDVVVFYKHEDDSLHQDIIKDGWTIENEWRYYLKSSNKQFGEKELKKI